MFNLGSSYFHVALTTVRHLLNVCMRMFLHGRVYIWTDVVHRVRVHVRVCVCVCVVSGVIAMHLETLDAVHQESKRLPPVPKVFLALLFSIFPI